MNFFDIGLIIALSICGFGIVWRLLSWRQYNHDSPTIHQPAGGRFWARRLMTVFQQLVLDGVLLRRTATTGILRWIAHMFVFIGFMHLLLFHALDGFITEPLFPDYVSTLDPWQFLRNLSGLMVFVGLLMMVVRRVGLPKLRKLSLLQDWGLLTIVGAIVVSGFVLESSKILSPDVYQRMVDEYFVPIESEDEKALKAYWAKEYGVIFAETLPMDESTLKRGAALDEESCTYCHSKTSSAFVSFSLASILSPVAGTLSQYRADIVLWYAHCVFCFLGLAIFPYGKMVHPLTTLANLVFRKENSMGSHEGAVGKVLQTLGIESCTRCGACSLHCSVAPSYTVLKNAAILPSEKLRSVTSFWKKKLSLQEPLHLLAHGSRICTDCYRCTAICPSGIHLQDIWMRSKHQLSQIVPDTHHVMQGMDSNERLSFYTAHCLPHISDLEVKHTNAMDSYWACMQCTTCTSVCPVVAVCEDPSKELDLTPQQIMNLLRMGRRDLVLGARMVWSCTTCYKCQEHCPQNIPVADVLFELRNIASHGVMHRAQSNLEKGT